MNAEPEHPVGEAHQRVPAWLLAILCFGGTLGMHILVSTAVGFQARVAEQK
ncbi:hypothetical protein [Bosea sp. NPDC055594]